VQHANSTSALLDEIVANHSQGLLQFASTNHTCWATAWPPAIPGRPLVDASTGAALHAELVPVSAAGSSWINPPTARSTTSVDTSPLKPGSAKASAAAEWYVIWICCLVSTPQPPLACYLSAVIVSPISPALDSVRYVVGEVHNQGALLTDNELGF
jgi:hypothetical protein